MSNRAKALSHRRTANYHHNKQLRYLTDKMTILLWFIYGHLGE